VTVTRDPVLQWASQARAAGERYGIPTAVLLGLTRVESGGNIHAVSSAGAFGLTQFIPSTAAHYGVRDGDAASQFDGAARYLRDLGFAKDPSRALNQYNGAQTIGGRVNPYAANVLAAARDYGHVPTGGAPAGDPAAPAPASSTDSDVLKKHGGDAMHALVWAGLVAAGGALVVLGTARATGARQPHGAIA
jgi:hypothetical protein